MANETTRNLMPYGLGAALLAAGAHLGWELTHGGVESHHLLHNPDLPAISNWWGLLVLPLLGMLASHSVTSRLRTDGTALSRALAFAGALLTGASLAASFAWGYESVATAIFLVALTSGLVLPTYRAEYPFGFVLGMTSVFGAVLPAIVACVAAAISAAAHFLVRPALGWLLGRVRAR